jgi:hypothetical protein
MCTFWLKRCVVCTGAGSSASTAIRNSVAPVAIHYPPFPETLLDLQVLDL